MNAFEGTVQKFDEETVKCFKSGYGKIEALNQDVRIYLRRLHEVIEEYQATGTFPSLKEFENWEDVVANAKSAEKKRNNNEVQKENVEPQNGIRSSSRLKERPKRNIKKEKLSISTIDEDTTDASENLQNIKKEKDEQEAMPPPTRAVKRKRKTKNKVQVKQEKIEKQTEEMVRESDVILQNAEITVIDLVDSSDEGDKTLQIEEKNQTPTQSKVKRSRTEQDVISTGEKNERNDATFIAKEKDVKEDIINTTVVVENPTYVNKCVPKTVNDLMTDDESEEETIKPPSKATSKIPKSCKQVFSPFEQSPVKTKIAAFEKLKEGANTLPPRTTRTKTRALAKQQQEEEEEMNRQESTIQESKNYVKEKVKQFTPVVSKFMPKAASTSVKPNRALSVTSNESLLSGKTASALKASQAEYRERERLRREREEESLKKREALIQAQIEEKKRKREEKQLKAQQLREAKEKEKLKFLEAQRVKEERHKQLLAEQEQKKLKQKEESEKKRNLAKMKAIEEKKKQEKKDAEVLRNLKSDKDLKYINTDKKPEYLISKAPLLPTDDCYDSDDELHKNAVQLPSWLQKHKTRFMLKCANAAGTAFKNTFFSVQAQTPDLEEIFEVIKPAKLKRTSSAIWYKMPRYTMVPGLETHDEEYSD